METNLENDVRKLKKLRKLVKSDITKINQHQGPEDNYIELVEWLNELNGVIAKLSKKN